MSQNSEGSDDQPQAPSPEYKFLSYNPSSFLTLPDNDPSLFFSINPKDGSEFVRFKVRNPLIPELEFSVSAIDQSPAASQRKLTTVAHYDGDLFFSYFNEETLGGLYLVLLREREEGEKPLFLDERSGDTDGSSDGGATNLLIKSDYVQLCLGSAYDATDRFSTAEGRTPRKVYGVDGKEFEGQRVCRFKLVGKRQADGKVRGWELRKLMGETDNRDEEVIARRNDTPAVSREHSPASSSSGSAASDKTPRGS